MTKQVQKIKRKKSIISIKLADYQLIQVKYHEDFETPTYEIIKIGKNYYLYSGGYYPSPISYFIGD